MSENELPPLSPELAELLARAPVPQMPPGFAESVRARVAVTLAAPASPPAATSAATPRAPRLGPWGLPLAATTLVIGGAAGLLVGKNLPRPTPPPPVVAPAPAPAPVVALPPPSLPAPTPRSPPAAPAREHVQRAPHEEIPRDLELASERTLIEIARAAVARRDAAAARQALHAHARRFPDGQFAEEREALRVQVAALEGDRARAKALAAGFHRRYPDSMLGPVVDAAAQ